MSEESDLHYLIVKKENKIRKLEFEIKMLKKEQEILYKKNFCDSLEEKTS